MRRLVDADRLRHFMREFGAAAAQAGRVYLTGGATAVLHGWRDSTIDIDLRVVPEQDALFRAIPRLKERLQINVELASPDQFIPVRADWEERSPFIVREGRLAFHHFDLCAQALAKIERGHTQDVLDVEALLRIGLVDGPGLVAYFEAIEPALYRYPSVDAATFRAALMRAVAER